MNYLLDTNIIIFFFRGKYNLVDKLREVGIQNCFISEITLAELKYGALCSNNPEKHLTKINQLLQDLAVIPISSCIDRYAQEKARLRRAGTLIDDFDLLIGATALTNDLIIVTNNVRHFDRLEDIVVEDWTKGNMI